MKKTQKKYVIGVDGGGTKTIAALADLKGKILTQSKSGPSHPRNVGIEKAVLNIIKAINQVLKEKKGEIVSTAIALPAIAEEYQDKKTELLKLLKTKKEISKIFQGKAEIFSDQLAAFRAGTVERDGVILISGTGCVAHGWRKDKEVKASGWGWLADEGGAFWVGHRVLRAVLKDLDKRGEKTLLTALVLQKFKIKKINDLLRKVYMKSPTETIPQFSILCDKASQKGDKVAKKIMITAGREAALAVKTAIYELNFQKTKFPLVLVGSMFKTKIILDRVKREVKKLAPKARFIRLKKKPVRGAVRLALEQVRIGP